MTNIPKNLTSDSAYMLGMLYGKGDILISSNNQYCELSFKIKYRRPTVDALRTDNENVELMEINDDTIEVAVFNEFQRFSRIFHRIMKVPEKRNLFAFQELAYILNQY